ncbi:MAG: DUF4177 domain-containing protein [Clostridia bacterium]|nr:DUF4177 domain-containing protein [Clostridia bacterium]
MYFVTTFATKTNIFGSTNTQKADNELTAFINGVTKDGWSLVTMTQIDTSGRAFCYKLVFKK